MSIEIDKQNLAGYIRTRTIPGKTDDKGRPVLELWLDTQLYFLPDSLIATVPESCCGCLYYKGDGSLEVRYPGI